MTDPTTKVRMDNLIRDLHVSAKLAIRTDRRKFDERASVREERLREAALEYEQYLLTLDPSTLSSLLESPKWKSVFAAVGRMFGERAVYAGAFLMFLYTRAEGEPAKKHDYGHG